MNKINVQMQSDAEIVIRWLGTFEQALKAGDEGALRAVLAEECHWRDLLAFTWNITLHDDRDHAMADLRRAQPTIQAQNFRLAETRTPPRRVKRHGIDSIEAFFSFETKFGRGSGIVRLITDRPERAWVLATSLDELKGHEEPINMRRPAGSAYSRNFGGDNWSDIRGKEQTFADREPAVLIVGAGQAGLAVAARLRLLGRGYADLGQAQPRGRYLARALSLAGAAQSGKAEPHALPALAAQLAEVSAERHDCWLA